MHLRGVVRSLLDALLRPLGLEVRGRAAPEPDRLAWFFPELVRQAAELGVDVNDHEDALEGWEPAAPLVERYLAPLLPPGAAACEIGPGTGRWSRHVARRAASLHLVDHSPWLVQFLRRYFGEQPQVQVHQGDGSTLPVGDGFLDLVYAVGTFVALKLGTVAAYAREAARTLKPGGSLVFDYIDLRRPEAWAWLDQNSRSPEYAGIYAYHDGAHLRRVLEEAGLAVVSESPAGYNTFLHARKA